MLNKCILYVVCCQLTIMVGQVLADVPMRPAFDHVVCSNNSRYCAFISPTEGVKGFKIEGGRNNIEPTYTIAGWYLKAYLSDDGQKLIVVQPMISPAHVKDEFAVRVWVGGTLRKSIYMHEILGKRRPIKTSGGNYVWCTEAGFDSDRRFVLKLNDGSKYEIKF